MTKLTSLIFCGLLAAATTAPAQFMLEITEIWPGNEPGSNLTEDWFELTNTGDVAWVAATDGDLYFDDDSFDSSTADLMSGIASIAPGESVIFVDGSAIIGAANVTDWSNLWDDVVNLGQVGTYQGAGLSGSGDGVGIFLDADLNGIDGSDPLIDSELYPDAFFDGGQSYDVILGAFSTVGNAHGAVATIGLNDENQPAIASPFSIIPEPTSALLGLLGFALIFRRRNSR